MAAGQGMQPRPGQPQLARDRVEDIVQTNVVAARPDTPLPTLAEQMAEKQVGSVVIVEDDEPVGIVTDRKIALALESDPDMSDREARELISDDVVTGSTEMSVFDVLEQLSDHGIRRLPIVDENDELVGIVTLDDLLVVLSTELSNATEIVEQQSPRF